MPSLTQIITDKNTDHCNFQTLLIEMQYGTTLLENDLTLSYKVRPSFMEMRPVQLIKPHSQKSPMLA